MDGKLASLSEFAGAYTEALKELLNKPEATPKTLDAVAFDKLKEKGW